jgi:hypothetical protein
MLLTFAGILSQPRLHIKGRGVIYQSSRLYYEEKLFKGCAPSTNVIDGI